MLNAVGCILVLYPISHQRNIRWPQKDLRPLGGLRAVSEGSFWGWALPRPPFTWSACHLSRKRAVWCDWTSVLLGTSCRRCVCVVVLFLRESLSCLLQEEAIRCEHSTATGLTEAGGQGNPRAHRKHSALPIVNLVTWPTAGVHHPWLLKSSSSPHLLCSQSSQEKNSVPRPTHSSCPWHPVLRDFFFLKIKWKKSHHFSNQHEHLFYQEWGGTGAIVPKLCVGSSSVTTSREFRGIFTEGDAGLQGKKEVYVHLGELYAHLERVGRGLLGIWVEWPLCVGTDHRLPPGSVCLESHSNLILKHPI